ncbi:MAG TPA: DUF6072 family protein [Vicinamibacterales bacterium]
MPDTKTTPIGRGLRVAADMLLLPGSSLLLDGKVKPGLLHVGVGVAAGFALGIPAALLVAANSISLSFTGKNLASALIGAQDPRDVTLTAKIRQDVDKGLSLEEIQETVREDVEDVYAEVVPSHPPPPIAAQ